MSAAVHELLVCVGELGWSDLNSRDATLDFLHFSGTMVTLGNMNERLSGDAIQRYSRQIRLPGVGIDGQERLRAARALVIGAGGLGSPAAMYLVSAGIGTLGFADFDVVELHNLQRQILYAESDVGCPKVDCATSRLHALNDDVNLVCHEQGLTEDNALELFSGYDVIIDGSDNFPTRYLSNDAAFFTGKTLVYGSIFQFDGQVSVFDRTVGTPCYRCLFPHPPAPGTVPSCEEAGVFGALPGIIGSMQALEALKIILGIGEPLFGRLLSFDGLRQRVRTLALKADPECPLCGEHPSIITLRAERPLGACAPSGECPDNQRESAETTMPIEVPINVARKMLADNDGPYLLDVRESYETEICRLPGAHHIPLRSLATEWVTLPRDRPIIAYCHHGMRSLKAANILREKGLKDAMSLVGGIDQWAREVEPEMRRY